jgi:hypothetical protein
LSESLLVCLDTTNRAFSLIVLGNPRPILFAFFANRVGIHETFLTGTLKLL